MNPAAADRLNEVIAEELNKLLKEGVTEDELNEQRNGLLQAQEVRRTSDSSLAQLISGQTRVGRTMKFTARFEKAVNALTVDDVNAALRRHIKPERLYIVMAGDFEKAVADE